METYINQLSTNQSLIHVFIVYMLISICYRASSIPRKQILKEYQPPKHSFLSQLFHRSQSSPTYPLLHELFHYLQTTPLIPLQFPLLKSSPRYQTNFMSVHCRLLSNRLHSEKGLPKSELQAYEYNMKNYFFVPYAKFVERTVPVEDFAEHFIQGYEKRYRLFGEELRKLGGGEETTLESYNQCFGKIVYENRVDRNSAELNKVSKYYIAHEKYLASLSYADLIKWKVWWGFTKDPELIGNSNTQ